jgi:hypothetical protein
MAVVLTDIQIAFATGALFADAGAKVIEASRRDSEAALANVYGSYMLRSLAYSGIFLGPVATVSLLAYPAWETQYISPIFDQMLGNPGNAGYYGAFLAVVFGAAWFGNWLGFRWVLAGFRKRLRVTYLVLIALTFAVVWARYPAPVRVGTYAEFVANPNALPLYTEDPTFFRAFIILLVLAGLPILIGFLQIRKSVKLLQEGSRQPLEARQVPLPGG